MRIIQVSGNINKQLNSHITKQLNSQIKQPWTHRYTRGKLGATWRISPMVSANIENELMERSS